MKEKNKYIEEWFNPTLASWLGPWHTTGCDNSCEFSFRSYEGNNEKLDGA